jgi:hypothetical protein
LRRAAATDARDAPFSLVSSLQWARLSNDWNGAFRSRVYQIVRLRLVSLV